MIRRIDQQLLVNRLMIDIISEEKVTDKNTRRYMLKYLDAYGGIFYYVIRSGTEENLEKKKELWRYLKSADIHIYRKLYMSVLGRGVNLPGRSGRRLSVTLYKVAQKFYGFN